ncbi:MAG: hypothetical protein ABR951_07415 [Candidatus Aminicenantales bacterium]|jgi:hypothetical protein
MLEKRARECAERELFKYGFQRRGSGWLLIDIERTGKIIVIHAKIDPKARGTKALILRAYGFDIPDVGSGISRRLTHVTGTKFAGRLMRDMNFVWARLRKNLADRKELRLDMRKAISSLAWKKR